MRPLYIIIFTLIYSTLVALSGSSLAPITHELLNKYKGSAKVFKGTIVKVEKKYLLDGRPYKITPQQLKKIQNEAYAADKPKETTYWKLRLIHRFTIQVVHPISENTKTGEKIVLDIIDHPDSMCPHYKAFPKQNRSPDFLPEPNVWMLYQKPEKFGILREEHAFLSQEDWKKLKPINK